MLVLQEEQLYTNFIESCRAPKIKLNYRNSLHYFMKFHNYTKYGDLCNGHEYEDIKSYILDMKARQLSTISMKMHLCAIKCFYEMNDIENIKWKKLFRFRGEDTMTNEDRAYTHEEIQKMLTTADLRLKAVILLMASSGMRIGALPTLKVSDCKGAILKGDQPHSQSTSNAVTVYSRTSSKYITFMTPEAQKAIDDYLPFRERCGERITSDSPLDNHKKPNTPEIIDNNADSDWPVTAILIGVPRPIIIIHHRHPITKVCYKEKASLGSKLFRLIPFLSRAFYDATRRDVTETTDQYMKEVYRITQWLYEKEGLI